MVGTRELLELMHTAIVVGTAIAAMWGLFDLFKQVHGFCLAAT